MPEQQEYPDTRPESPTNAVGSDYDRLYEPLELNRHRIRLLKIDQLDFDGHNLPSLHCSLIVASLDENPEYDALSYTWDDPGDLKNIYINSRVFPIRRNLFNALCTISAVFQRPIWADAVCINQEDILERNQQVQLMTEIYTHAQTVRIWLGLEIPGVDAFFAKAASGHLSDSLISNSSDDGSREGFRHVMSRQWWQRLWTVQEAVLARHATVHCGFKTIPWTRLYSCIYEFSKGVASVEYAKEQLDIIGLSYLVRSTHSIEAFRPWQDSIRGPTDFDLLIHLMDSLSKRDMSDEKDLVYGALGLLPEYLRVKVDYSLSLTEVFRNFAVRIMQWTASLELLSECRYPVQDNLLPTWVPDFRNIETMRGDDSRYNASLDAPCRVRQIHGDNLTVQACVFDEIAAKGRPILGRANVYLSDTKSVVTFLRTVLKDWLHLMNTSHSRSNMVNRNTRFWNTILQSVPVTAIGFDTAPISARKEVAMSELQHWLDSTEDELTPSAEKHLLQKHINGSTFCVSKSGRPILCRIEPNVGDRIAILPTCKVPLILRPCPGQLENTFQIVGCCYYEGVMYGEYVRTISKVRINNFPVHTDDLSKRLLDSVLQLHTVPNCFVHVTDLGYFKSVLAQIAADIETDSQSAHSGSFQSLQALDCNTLTILTKLSEQVYGERRPASPAHVVKWLVIDETDVVKVRKAIISVACAFDKLMSKLEIFQRSDLCNDKQLCEATEALALCISIYAFEMILCVERAKTNSDKSVITEHFTRVQQLVEEAFGFLTEGGASKTCYTALKHAALQEFEIEKATASLYQEIVLI